MALKRQEIKDADRWDVESLFSSWSEWNELFLKLEKDEVCQFKELLSCKGTFAQGPSSLSHALTLYFSIDRQLTRLCTYAHLRLDEDLTDARSKEGYGRIMILLQQFSEQTSWIEPEILALDQPDLYLNDPVLAQEKIYLTKLFHRKPHVLDGEKEELLALAQQTLSAPSKIFSNFNNADLRFDTVLDNRGASRELTLGTYQLYMRGDDRVLRKNSFEGLHGKYEAFENSLSEILSSQVQAHLFSAKTRNYSSCLEAALFGNKIPVSVYTSLLDCVSNRLTSLHRYCALRRKWLQVDELYPYDLSVPLLPDLNLTFSKDQACQEVIDSVAPLGTEYRDVLKQGLTKARWVDFFESHGKRSGAYSSGCYDSAPFILMNFHGTISDLFTLAHEAGHSMHSYFSRKRQSYINADYPIFVAEVASTFNELLLLDHLLEKTDDLRVKSYLVNYQIEGLRATLFRQTQFAMFELFVHQLAEKKEPITPAVLKAEYSRLHKQYYGDALTEHSLSAIEWARIPHFYYNFYVYQYATGISAAYALHRQIKKDPDKKEGYLRFLSSGGSAYPLDLLKMAGVDMHSNRPIDAAIDAFDEALNLLESLYPRS